MPPRGKEVQMPFRIRYTMSIDWVGAGAGPMEVLSNAAGQMLPGGGASGQTKTFVTNPVLIPVTTGLGAGGTVNGTDVTNLTNAMAADMAAQLTNALPTVNGWVSGNP